MRPGRPDAAGLTAALADSLRDLLAHRPLVVGVDFDGTLAPLVDDPMDAAPLPGAMGLLRALSDLPDVTVALVSGRALAVLGELSGGTDPLVLIGSHGAESSLSSSGSPLDAASTATYTSLEHGLEAILDTHPGTRLERKPTSLVLHTRGLPGDVASDAVQAGAALARRHTGVHMTPGKDVLELAMTEAGKGPALLALAHETGAHALMYVGDDVTDERAFRHLRDHAGDKLHVLAVKVGPGASIAHVRVPDEAATVGLLRELLTLLTAPRSSTHPGPAERVAEPGGVPGA